MTYEGYTTFKTRQEGAVLTVTFDFGPVNVQGQEMLEDLTGLAMRLERDRDVKVVVFDSLTPKSGYATTTPIFLKICQWKRYLDRTLNY